MENFKRILCLVVIFILTYWVVNISPADIHAKTKGIHVKAKRVDGATTSIRLYSGYHALIVGCGDYRSGWPCLSNPVKEAREVADSLKDMGWDVKLLEDPDWKNLRRSLNKLIIGPGRKKDKAILFWFSGHGHTLEEAGGRALGYIVPVDAPNPDRDELGFMEHAISMRQIETVAKRIKARHVLMLFDSCFSGAIFQAVKSKPSPYIQEKVSKPVRQFITAGTEDEQVPDFSVFKVVFLQAIKDGYADRNKDGYITGLELGDYLQEQVINYSRKAQHPQFGKINDPKLDKGDFVFTLKSLATISPSSTPAIPSLPPESGEIADYETVIEQRKAAKRKWKQWQIRMEKEFAKATSYDNSPELTFKEKKEVWSTFLSSYKADNPHSTKDDELRSKATARLRHWKEFIVAMGKRPAVSKKPGGIWRDPATGMEFVWVSKGCFKMGSPSGEKDRFSDEGPVHEVCVDGFWIGKYEVTNKEYRKFKSNHNSKDYKGKSLNAHNQPAVYVSWDDAKAFAKWLTQKNEGRYTFRLPTEAEWEYAARAGTKTVRYWGDDPDDACRYANVHDQTSKRINKFSWQNHNCDDGYAVTSPVGSFQPNDFGLYDMIGNVWEWCEDMYSKNAYSNHRRNNPINTGGGSLRVARGGRWYSGARVCRSAVRSDLTPGLGDDLLGFRLLRE